MAGTADLDQIDEYSADHGVWIDGVLLKDGYVSGRSLGSDSIKLDSIEVGADVTDSDNVKAAGAIVSHSKLDATSAPTVFDDSSVGYAIGSRWADVSNLEEYVCLDANIGSALWVQTTENTGMWMTESGESRLIVSEDIDIRQKELIAAAIETLTTAEREALIPVSAQLCFDSSNNHLYVNV